ncbi:hypothetical protein F5Y06DRAFT_18650 [Hypoxylon sp. FL0890]|nr:hypothetical protein F5Y06DRAFT_18650 [Hypoxylon sp. FL0890]
MQSRTQQIMSKDENTNQQSSSAQDDEPDEWDKRIFSTGCADENMKLTDCYYEKKDWRACKKEVDGDFQSLLEETQQRREDINKRCVTCGSQDSKLSFIHKGINTTCNNMMGKEDSKELRY